MWTARPAGRDARATRRLDVRGNIAYAMPHDADEEIRARAGVLDAVRGLFAHELRDDE